MLDAEAQSLALADRIVDDACMLAQHMALPVHEWAGLRLLAGAQLNDAGIVAVRYEADILTVALSGVYKAMLLGNLTRLGLVQRAEREAQMRQLVLIQEIQHIALVLAVVHGLFQEPAAVFLLDAGIVPRGDGITAKQLRALDELGEFHVAVAVDAGVRCRAALIGIHKAVHHLLAEAVREIEHIERHTELIGHAARILDVFERAAALFARHPGVLIVEQPHRRADTLAACLR